MFQAHENVSNCFSGKSRIGNICRPLVLRQVERKYFPENFKFWPFGDPFIEKRRHDARKAKEAEEVGIGT